MKREEALLSWVHAHSFISAHTDIGEWEQWMEQTQRILPVHEEGASIGPFRLSSWCPA